MAGEKVRGPKVGWRLSQRRGWCGEVLVSDGERKREAQAANYAVHLTS